MYSTSVPSERKCGARSCASSITNPKRSSMPIESSMKSSESSPSDPSTSLGSTVARDSSGSRLGANLSRSTMMSLSSWSTLSLSTRSPLPWPRGRGHVLPSERLPDVEEIEPLSRVLPHDDLERRDPGPRGRLLLAARGGERLEDLHRVPIPRVHQAEGRQERDPDPAGEQERSERKPCRSAEEGNLDVALGAERPVPLHPHHLAASKRGEQLQRHGGTRPRDEPHPLAISPHPALQLPCLLWSDHHVGRPRGASREESPGQLPVTHVGRQRDEPAAREAGQPLEALHAGDVGGAMRGGLSVRRDQITEAHREVG